MGTENRKGPLKDVKVLDFTIALAGVYVAWQFADMGAEVWKVERYGSGDQARTWDPFVNGLSTLYTAYNKNKQSIELGSVFSGRQTGHLRYGKGSRCRT